MMTTSEQFNQIMRMLDCPVRAEFGEHVNETKRKLREWAHRGLWHYNEVRAQRDALQTRNDTQAATIAEQDAEIKRLQEACSYHYNDFLRERGVSAQYAGWLGQEEEKRKAAEATIARLRGEDWERYEDLYGPNRIRELEAEIRKLKGLPA